MEATDRLKTLTTLVYALQAAGFLLPPVVWIGAVLLADAIWIIYRVVKGWLNLSENRPMS